MAQSVFNLYYLGREGRVAHALPQQPQEGARDVGVVAPVDDLDGEHVEGADELRSL